MNIAVCGYKGYIGKRVYFRLKMLGLNPIGIDKGDKVPKSDVIVHLGARMDNSPEMVKNNFQLTFDVAQKARKVIFTSSAAVYGNVKGKTKETDVLNPINLYGKCKMWEEWVIQEFVEKYSILRLANVYSFDADHGVVALLLSGNKVLFDKGLKTRDYVLVDDVVDVIVKATLTDKWNGIYNIGTGKATSSIELFKRLCSGRKPIFKKKDEITHSCLDITKAKKKGFKPFVI